MPTAEEATFVRTVEQLAVEIGNYPIDAFWFVQNGLQHTAHKVHGAPSRDGVRRNRHVSGQDLAVGLKEFAQDQWGRMARTVLAGWNIRSTYDFGQIVFAMIRAGLLQKQPQDSIEDFRDVFEFREAFEDYRIALK
ncbi:MAG: hypothetical protein QM770_04835 [Tepidisphaeraceae bacterium]